MEHVLAYMSIIRWYS